MEKKKNQYFEPDYRQLNKKARRTSGSENGIQGRELLEKIFPGNKKTTASMANPGLLKTLDKKISAIKSSINWEDDLFGATYVAFDTETTGLFPYRDDRIISLGAVIIENDIILEEPLFYQLVNPKRSVPPLAQKITGINDEMLKEKPECLEVILDFLEFAGPRILIAHNAPFDLAFINRCLAEATGRRIVNPVIDTVLLTNALYYSFGDYSLENLGERFKLDLTGRHNALSDARIAAKLFLTLLPELKKKGIGNLKELSRLFDELDLTKGYPLVY